METNRSLADLSEQRLLQRFGDLVRQDRTNTAQLLAHIAEIDRRKLWAKHACPSMFAFCMQRFHMSESMTGKRIWAARTARRFPVILQMVAAGELHLSGINQLGKHLTDDNHQALLARAKHKSSREIDVLVAEIAPRPDVPSRIRALPGATAPVDAMATASGRVSEALDADEQCGSDRLQTGVGASNSAGAASGRAAGARKFAGAASERATDASKPAVGTSELAAAIIDASESAAGSSSSAAGAIKPVPARKQVVALAPRRFKIEITVDQCTHDKLRSLQDLLRHRIPSADPAMIVSHAIELLLDDTLKKKAAVTGHARSSARSGTRSGDARTSAATCALRTRAIPSAIRREVWKRDVGRCAFVDDYGKRCKATSCIEYHHEIPFAKGGRHSVENVSLRCRAHNQYQAELDYGREFMRRASRSRNCF